MAKKRGIPPGANPFCVIGDNCIDDGILVEIAPDYFVEERDAPGGQCATAAPARAATSRWFTPDEMERLVAKLSEADVVGSFAVREEYGQIIPTDLRDRVPVTKSRESRCSINEIYYLIS